MCVCVWADKSATAVAVARRVGLGLRLAAARRHKFQKLNEIKTKQKRLISSLSLCVAQFSRDSHHFSQNEHGGAHSDMTI